MFNLSNLTAYVEPTSIPPVVPDFSFCHSAYGNLRQRKDAIMAAGILPPGTIPMTVSVTRVPDRGRAQSYTLPFHVSYAGVAISVEVSGPAFIDEITLVPNSIRGMAAYLANTCVGTRGTGGFVTSSIQGLVDFVTDPTADVELPNYPASSAFITLAMSSPDYVHSLPGDFDPVMAKFLQQAEFNALGTLPPTKHAEIAIRALNYGVQAQRMRRLGDVAWWDERSNSGDQAGILRQPLDSSLNNGTSANTMTSRRKRKFNL